MKTKTLLEKALEHPSSKTREYDGRREEILELAIAYANRQISCSQASMAVYGVAKPSGSVLTRLSSALICAVRQGKISLTRVDK